jgi:hypothetical protein
MNNCLLAEEEAKVAAKKLTPPCLVLLCGQLLPKHTSAIPSGHDVFLSGPY